MRLTYAGRGLSGLVERSCKHGELLAIELGSRIGNLVDKAGRLCEELQMTQQRSFDLEIAAHVWIFRSSRNQRLVKKQQDKGTSRRNSTVRYQFSRHDDRRAMMNKSHMSGYLQFGHFEYSLSKVLAVEKTKQTLDRVVNACSDTHTRLVCSLVNPFLNILLMISCVFWAHVGVSNNESLHLQSLADDVHEVLDAKLLIRRVIVLTDHSARDCKISDGN